MRVLVVDDDKLVAVSLKTIFVTLPDDINAEMDAKWSEMKSYDESGSGWLIVVFLLGAIAISGFNIWRKMRKKVRDDY